MDIADDVREVVQAPFKQRLDIPHLFLVTGLVLVFVMMWVFILHHIKTAAIEVLEV